MTPSTSFSGIQHPSTSSPHLYPDSRWGAWGQSEVVPAHGEAPPAWPSRLERGKWAPGDPGLAQLTAWDLPEHPVILGDPGTEVGGTPWGFLCSWFDLNLCFLLPHQTREPQVGFPRSCQKLE